MKNSLTMSWGLPSEDRQSIFLATRQSNLEVAFSLAAMHLREDPSVRKDALDMWLRRKGCHLSGKAEVPGGISLFGRPQRP